MAIISIIIAIFIDIINAQNQRRYYTCIQTLNYKKKVFLIDLRTQDKYNSGHLGNAKLINFMAEDFKYYNHKTFEK